MNLWGMNKLELKVRNLRKSLMSIKAPFKKLGAKIPIETTGTMVILNDTFWDLYSPKKFLASIIIMLILPIFLLIAPLGQSVDFKTISIKLAATILSVNMIYYLYFWTLGIALISIIGASGASLISEEIHSGTMLILISKPVKRTEIFLGKYLGLFLYSTVLSFTAIFIDGWLNVLRYSQNIDHFIGILPFLGSAFLYSLLVNFLFVSITLALSSIFKKPRNGAIIVIFLAVFSFFGMMILKQFLGELYEDFQIYHFDLGYHLANVYVYFIELMNAIPPSEAWQYNFAYQTGVFKTTSTIDPDQEIYTGGLDKTLYYLPQFSLLVWVAVALFLLVFGIWKLRKRDFSI